MKRTIEVLVAIFVPFAGAFYASRWALRKFSQWREEERRTIADPTWHRDFARRVSYEESQASVSEPKTWKRNPYRSGAFDPAQTSAYRQPASSYTRAAR